MKRILSIISILLLHLTVHAQKIETIQFNLYTDSLIKGYHNYISVDGRTADGRWIPLTADDLILTSTAGVFEGNELLIDSAYHMDSVKVKAVLKKDTTLSKEITIYIRKRGFDEPLKSEEEILNELKSHRQKKRIN